MMNIEMYCASSFIRWHAFHVRCFSEERVNAVLPELNGERTDKCHLLSKCHERGYGMKRIQIQYFK